MPCRCAQRPIASTCSGGYTAPVGLDGEQNSSTLVRSVRAASSASTEARYPVVSSVGTSTATPPARAIASGYVVQYGAGSSTSSPGSSSVANASYTAILPPLVTSTWPASTAKPESRSVLVAIACRSSGRPPAGVSRWFFGSRQAATAASTT